MTTDPFPAIGPLLGSAFVPLAAELDVDLTSFVSGVQGGLICAIAVGSILCNGLAVKYGKRPIYLITSVGLVVTCFWAAAANSYASLVAARVVQGFCMAPMEALVPASIADIWCVELLILARRWTYTGPGSFTNVDFIQHCSILVSWAASISVLPLVSLPTLKLFLMGKLTESKAGPIIEYGSYKICLYAMGGAFILQLILTFFWMPETAFKRSGVLNIDTTAHNVSHRFSGQIFLY